MVVNVPATRNDVLTYDTYSLYGVCDVCACVGVMGGGATLVRSYAIGARRQHNTYDGRFVPAEKLALVEECCTPTVQHGSRHTDRSTPRCRVSCGKHKTTDLTSSFVATKKLLGIEESSGRIGVGCGIPRSRIFLWRT